MDKGKNIAIVTGGSKGIGKSISIGLAKKNTDLVITCFSFLLAIIKISGYID